MPAIRLTWPQRHVPSGEDFHHIALTRSRLRSPRISSIPRGFPP
jgi:hypothetical protein